MDKAHLSLLSAMLLLTVAPTSTAVSSKCPCSVSKDKPAIFSNRRNDRYAGILELISNGCQWIHQSPINGWNMDTKDVMVSVNVDGKCRDQILVYNSARANSDRWMALMPVTNSQLNPSWVQRSPIDGWKMDTQDKIIPADLDGNGKDELIFFSTQRQNDRYVSTMEYAKSAMKRIWIRKGNIPGKTDTCNLDTNDQVLAGDLNGDGDKEVVLFNVDSQLKKICVLDSKNKALNTLYYSQQKFSGWNMDSGDRALTADINGDKQQELIMLQLRRTDKWLAILSFSKGKFSNNCIWRDTIGTWKMDTNDYIVPADTDGDGKDELIVFKTITSGTRAVGIIRIEKGTCSVSVWSKTISVGSWRFDKNDQPYVADLDGNGKDEIILLSLRRPQDQYMGILKDDGTKGLISTTVKKSPIGNPSSWNLDVGDTIRPLKSYCHNNLQKRYRRRNMLSSFTSITSAVSNKMTEGEKMQLKIASTFY